MNMENDINKNSINAPNKKLLNNRKVIEEIHRHLWIESEKAGYDIGLNKAAQDWLKNFSKAWMRYHIPNNKGASIEQGLLLKKKKSSKQDLPKKKFF